MSACRSPLSDQQLGALLAYATRPGLEDPRLRYLAYAALGAGDSRHAFAPLSAAERLEAIRGCVDAVEMIRLMGTVL